MRERNGDLSRRKQERAPRSKHASGVRCTHRPKAKRVSSSENDASKPLRSCAWVLTQGRVEV